MRRQEGPRRTLTLRIPSPEDELHLPVAVLDRDLIDTTGGGIDSEIAEHTPLQPAFNRSRGYPSSAQYAAGGFCLRIIAPITAPRPDGECLRPKRRALSAAEHIEVALDSPSVLYGMKSWEKGQRCAHGGTATLSSAQPTREVRKNLATLVGRRSFQRRNSSPAPAVCLRTHRPMLRVAPGFRPNTAISDQGSIRSAGHGSHDSYTVAMAASIGGAGCLARFKISRCARSPPHNSVWLSRNTAM